METREDGLQSSVARQGYAFAPARAIREHLKRFGSLDDWPRFSESWQDLALDTYMADGGRYRRRRHAVFSADANGSVSRLAHQPHYQSVSYNPLNGGIARWFEPITPDIGAGHCLQTILRFCHAFFGRLAPTVASWRIEVHQFRIEARAGEEGRPTPEGLHRDGVDFVLVLLVGRRNVTSGTTTIHGLDGQQLGQFTLTEPLDSALLEDRRVSHGVTPVLAVAPATPASRDVLVVTFAADPAATRALQS